MQDVHLARIDLNLLVVLESLLDTRSVTATADRIGLTQSATSHALARLRSTLGDPLFVRSRGGLVPTERASALAGPLSDALDRLRRAVAPPPVFDPRTATRRFEIRTADYAEFVLLPALAARLAKSAPAVDLWLAAMDEDPLDLLARGRIDAFIGPVLAGYDRPDIRERLLFDEHFVCLVREGHPAATKRWTLAQFAALDHAFLAPRGRPGGAVDDVLAAHGLTRRIAVALPHFLVAPFVVANTDLVLTVPARIARTFAGFLPLRTVEPPVDIPGFSMALMWHERQHHDPAHEWFRNELVSVAAALDGGKSRSRLRVGRSSPGRARSSRRDRRRGADEDGCP